MRFAKISKLLVLLAIPAVAFTSAATQTGSVDPAKVRNQLNNPPAASGQESPSKPADSPASGENAQTQPSKRTAGSAPAEKSGARRDPFNVLLNKVQPGNGTPENLPPGKAGLMVGTLHVDGIVRGKTGMIAIVSNPQQRVYFVREGDKLYDGTIEHITLEAVSFDEVGKDAFGKPIERQVTKRLYPTPGEQQ